MQDQPGRLIPGIIGAMTEVQIRVIQLPLYPLNPLRNIHLQNSSFQV
jgi:hypothetical protein